MSYFADVWDKEDTWQADKKVVPASNHLISMFGGAPIIEHKVTMGKVWIYIYIYVCVCVSFILLW